MKLKANVKKAYTKADRDRIKKPSVKWVELEQKIEKVGGHESGRGFFLFYLNEKGEVFADSYYKTLAEAIDIAYCDCDVKPQDWRVVKPEDWD